METLKLLEEEHTNACIITLIVPGGTSIASLNQLCV